MHMKQNMPIFKINYVLITPKKCPVSPEIDLAPIESQWQNFYWLQ